jgi:phosphoglucosamine mutase
MVSSPVRPAGGLPVGQRLPSRSQVFFDGLSGIQLPDLPCLAPMAFVAKWGFVNRSSGHANRLLGRAGHADLEELTSGPVIVGQDSRNSGHMLATALSAGLTSAGLDVWNVGLCPTPTVAYLSESCDALGGIMISASHNPPGDNGIKFLAAMEPNFPASVQAEIEAALRGQLGTLPNGLLLPGASATTAPNW